MRSEMNLFARMAAFGVVIGGAYWFLTYEPAGSVMLTTFGVASGIAALAIWLGSRRRPPAADAHGRVAVAWEPPGEPVTQPAPRPGWAPLGVAIGLGGVALAGAFGPALAIAGIFVAVRSGKAWLDAQMEEVDAAHAAEGESAADPPDGAVSARRAGG